MGELASTNVRPGDGIVSVTVTVVFQKAPPAANTSPLAGYQFFGEVEIDGASGVLTVTLRDVDGVAQFRQPILPDGAAPHAAA